MGRRALRSFGSLSLVSWDQAFSMYSTSVVLSLAFVPSSDSKIATSTLLDWLFLVLASSYDEVAGFLSMNKRSLAINSSIISL
jgi:hypothetical protein